MKFTDEELAAHVQSVFTPVYMTTKSEIFDYFIDTHGQNKRAAASAAATFITGQTSGKEYRNARRNFEGGREHSVSKSAKDKAKWESLGQKLPPKAMIPPKGGVKVKMKGKVKISGGGRQTKKGKKRGDGYAHFKHTWTLKGTDMMQPSMNNLFTDYFSNFQKNPVVDYDITDISIEAAE